MVRGRYGNTALARDYMRIINPKTWSSNVFYRRIERFIKNSPVDIPNLYRTRGSLNKLRVSGIGKDTKLNLEIILRRKMKKRLSVGLI